MKERMERLKKLLRIAGLETIKHTNFFITITDQLKGSILNIDAAASCAKVINHAQSAPVPPVHPRTGLKAEYTACRQVGIKDICAKFSLTNQSYHKCSAISISFAIVANIAFHTSSNSNHPPIFDTLYRVGLPHLQFQH